MAIDKRSMTLTDDKGNVLREPKKDEADKGRFSWWKAKDETQIAMEVASTVNFIQRHQSARTEQLTVSTRLYGNTSAFSLMGTAFTRASAVAPSPSSQRISFNLCASVVDTLLSQIAKDKIIPTFITSGGKWGMQKKAENLSKFLDGCFYENKVHDKMCMMFRDGAIWGDGILHIFRGANDRICVERVLPQEMLVDTVEAMVTKPSQCHRVKIVDRDVLRDQMADVDGAVEKIDSAMPANMQDVSSQMSAADLIQVVESWHLPSGEDADDGLHCICLEDKVLFQEPWTRDHFPFVFYHYNKRPLGFWGQGAVERLQNLQGEINRLMMLDQRSRWMMSSFKILVENGSKVVSQHLDNQVGTIIHYSGTPPQYILPPAIDPSNGQQIDSLIEKGYRQEGVSMLSASNVKPLGVNSGAALRTYDKIADDRQLYTNQQIEAAILEIGHQMIETVKDIYKDKKSYKVKWAGTRFIDTIDWKEVQLERDEYVLKAFPTSSLPDEPAAKLETVQEYMQAGLVSPRAGRRLMRTEDIEMSDMLANAAEDLISKTIEAIIYDKDDSVRPDGNWDLQLCKQLIGEYYNFALLNNCPEENMQMLRDFQGYVDDILGLTQAAQAPMPGANGPAQPMAGPMPTPQSNMVPNVQGAAS